MANAMPILRSQYLPERALALMPLSIPPKYYKNLCKKGQMAVKGILWPTLQIILQTHYPLVVQHQPPITSSPKIPPSPAPPPCAEPGLLGDNQVDQEVNSFKALASNKMGQLGEIEPKRVLLKRSQQLGMVEPGCACPTLKPLSANTGVKRLAPEPPRLSRREIQTTPLGGFRHAGAGELDQGGHLSLGQLID